MTEDSVFEATGYVRRINRVGSKKMKFFRKYNSQIIGIVLIPAVLYFGSYFGLRAIYLPPKLVVLGKSATPQMASGIVRLVFDAPISVPFGLEDALNWAFKPINDYCRMKTGLGLYFIPPVTRGNIYQYRVL